LKIISNDKFARVYISIPDLSNRPNMVMWRGTFL